MAAAMRADDDPRRQRPLPRPRRRRTTTPSGASPTASSARARWSASCARRSAREPRPLRARARDRRRHRLLRPQPAAAGRDRAAPSATDISPGHARRAGGVPPPSSGSTVETARCEAAELPFPDDSFDLVFGHAVLHHLPDLEAAFAEFRRVLRPGGRIAFCGEPSHYGDRLAERAQARRPAVAPLWRALMRAAPRERQRHRRGQSEEDELERSWTCTPSRPAELVRHARARRASRACACSGEELAASLFGWANRSLEATAEPDEVPWAWRQYAYRGYLALQARRPRAARAAAAGGALLQPAGLGARAPALDGETREPTPPPARGRPRDRSAKARRAPALTGRSERPHPAEHGVEDRQRPRGTGAADPPARCPRPRAGPRTDLSRAGRFGNEGLPAAARAPGATPRAAPRAPAAARSQVATGRAARPGARAAVCSTPGHRPARKERATGEDSAERQAGGQHRVVRPGASQATAEPARHRGRARPTPSRRASRARTPPPPPPQRPAGSNAPLLRPPPRPPLSQLGRRPLRRPARSPRR